jgi:hypothetical protein
MLSCDRRSAVGQSWLAAGLFVGEAPQIYRATSNDYRIAIEEA